MKACEKIDRVLDAYAAGELSDEQAFEVEKHLQRCSRCAVQLANIQQIKRMANEDLPQPSQREWDNVWREMSPIITATEPASPSRRVRILWPVVTSLAAMILAVVAWRLMLPFPPELSETQPMVVSKTSEAEIESAEAENPEYCVAVRPAHDDAPAVVWIIRVNEGKNDAS